MDSAKYAIGIGVIVGIILVASVQLGLQYSQAAILFAGVAGMCAPIVVKRIENPNLAIFMLVGLGLFASFPLKQLFQLEGLMLGILVTAPYVAALWVIGAGWRRRWS